MTGMRVGTLPSPDLILDTYATIGDDGIVRIIAGARVVSGTRYVQVNNIARLGLPKAGSLNVHMYSFDSNPEDQHFWTRGWTDGSWDGSSCLHGQLCYIACSEYRSQHYGVRI